MKKLLTALGLITIAMLSCKKNRMVLPVLTTTAASNVTANSITTGGNITNDGNSGITKRGIAWADHTNPTVGDSITNDGTGGGNFATTLSALNANTTYYIRAYAINASGTGYGNEITVKTSAGVPTITTTAISNIQPLSAVSGGNITNDGGITITERGVVYSSTANPTINNFKITASGTGTGSFTATLQPLASQTTYYVRAYATNAFGTGYGNQVQFNAASANTATDIDGNVYPYVTLCGKDWMALSLKTTKYKNGDAITDGTVANFNWLTNTTGAYTYPNGQQSNDAQQGKLYNLEAVRDSRGVCPAGWHVATDADWQAAEICMGMSPTDADSYFSRCCVGQHFLEGGSSGLEIKKSGQLFFDESSGNIQWIGFGTRGIYWTSTISPLDPTLISYRVFNRADDPQLIYRQFTGRPTVNSVRCVKD